MILDGPDDPLLAFGVEELLILNFTSVTLMAIYYYNNYYNN